MGDSVVILVQVLQVLIVLGLAPALILVGGGVLKYVVAKRVRGQFASGLSYVEEQLSQANFNISRKIGVAKGKGFDFCSSFFLYVDDVNKKWVMTSPMDSSLDKIRGYDELLAYDFFDEDSNSWIDTTGKIGKGAMTAVGATTGLILGAFVGLGAWGAIGGGAGMSKLASIGQSSQGYSGSYGLILKTSDADVNNPVLVFDFVSISHKPSRPERKGAIYKKDMAVIREMVDVFEYICRSSQ